MKKRLFKDEKWCEDSTELGNKFRKLIRDFVIDASKVYNTYDLEHLLGDEARMLVLETRMTLAVKAMRERRDDN